MFLKQLILKYPKKLGTTAAGQVTQPNVNGALLASKALGIGTLISVGAFGLLSAAVLYGSGCNSIEELIQTWRVWTPRKRKELLHSIGLTNKDGESRIKQISEQQQEDIDVTKNMNENEEWDYIKKKYFPEFTGENSDVKTES